MPMPTPTEPSSYPRRALVCVAGLAPQVVTETLHALARADGTPFVPTELHLITTAPGESAIRQRLLHPMGLAALADDLGLDVPWRHGLGVHVQLVTRDELPVDDIVTAADNTAVANTVLRVLRELCRDPACAIHASIAGGRKSMGFYLGYVLSLIGRPQDRLSQVLVNTPFESHPGFMYPPAHPTLLPLAEGRHISTAEARIDLAPIAFVRMADGLALQLQSEDLDFDILVQRAQRALLAQHVEVMPASRSVRMAGVQVQLEPAQMAWYMFFAMRRCRGLQESQVLKEPGLVLVHKDPDRSIGMDQHLLDLACDRVGIEKLSARQDPAELRARVSPINRLLLRGLGSELSRKVWISGPADRGTRDGQYGIVGVDASHLHVL
jgi:CRISPR-associated protein (TIGR02584 family)